MVTIDDIRAAAGVVYGVAVETPCLHSLSLSETFGAPVYLKAECLQHTGSFKVRGAANRIAMLTPEQRASGVVTASAGNHAQGVAIAARAAGVSAKVVMPKNAALAKLQATRGYGATVLLQGESFAEAQDAAFAIAAEERRVMVPPFDDDAIIAGQGTVGLELAEQCRAAQLVLVPVGGGGLIAGVATAVKALLPSAKVVGVQAAAAPAAARSLAEHRRAHVDPRPTLADGVAVPSPGALTLPLMERYVDDIVVVDEEAIAQGIVMLLERGKLVAEGAGALGVAALIAGAVRTEGRTTAVVVSGGNIDINVLATIVQHGLLHAGRYLTLTVGLDDRPGTLASLLRLIADCSANVLEVNHIRQGMHLPVRGVAVRLLLETRDQAHIEEVAAALRAAGYVETAAEATSRSYRPSSWG
ncbi:MAG TPA: threonine ammonia-lyase [Dehalococcoidia bacterium]|nr:threonine ammonia-lyase [Dehalococcoidia bacterium]